MRHIISFVIPNDNLFKAIFNERIFIDVVTGNGRTGIVIDDGLRKRSNMRLQVASSQSKWPYHESARRNTHIFNEGLKEENAGTNDYVDTLTLSREESLVHAELMNFGIYIKNFIVSHIPTDTQICMP
jgi:hypothetical protein